MRGDVEVVENPATVVVDHEEAVQQMESQGRHGEEVQRDDGFAVVLQECQPALNGIGRAGSAAERVARHGAFGNLKAEFQQPWILGAPQEGFSPATRLTSSKTLGSIFRRPSQEARERNCQ